MASAPRYRVQILIECKTLPFDLRVMNLPAHSPAQALRIAICQVTDRALYFPNLHSDIVVIPGMQLAAYFTEGWCGSQLAMLATLEGSRDTFSLMDVAKGGFEDALYELPVANAYYLEPLDASFQEEFAGMSLTRVGNA